MPRVSGCTAVVAICVMAMSDAIAQDIGNSSLTAPDSELIEEIIVTGTRIPRRDFFSASPIVTLDRTEMGITGTTEIKRLLNELPQVDPALGGGTGNEFPGTGTSRISLRGLGDGRTLVLLNGRRYPSNGLFGAVDLNAIPPNIIERVEVISGGASAVYGSDAMAGAINFILRNDFDGLEISAQYDVTEHGDGDTYDLGVAWGAPFSNGKGNITVFGNYLDRSTVFQSAREFSRIPLTTDDDTGEIISNSSATSPAGGIAGTLGVDFYTFDPNGVPRLFVSPDDEYNTSFVNALLAPMERYSANVLLNYEIGDSISANVEFNYTKSTPEQIRSNAFRGTVDVNVDRPDISPEFMALLATDYDPDTDGVAQFRLLRRFGPEQGRPVRINDRAFYRAAFGLDGELESNWTWSASYSFAETDAEMRVRNDNSVSRIRQGLLVDPLSGTCFDTSGGCVPVNPFGAGAVSEAAADFIALNDAGIDENLSEQGFTVVVGGPLFATWAGDIDSSIGFEYRRTEVDFRPSDSIVTGDSLFFGSDLPVSGDISVGEAFAEFRVPLLAEQTFARYLGLEMGARWSDYNTLDDDVWTWKAGAEWQVNDGFRLRAMLQKAIRVPNAAEAFQSPISSGFFPPFGLFFDQCSASRDPIGTGLTDLCVAQGIPSDQIGVYEAGFFPTAVTFTSNSNLDAEEADTVTLGFVLQPKSIENLSLSVDYVDIEIDNAISIMFPDQSASLCFLSVDPNSDFCNTFTRDGNGNIDNVLITFLNVSLGSIKAVDYAIDYSWHMEALALFDGSSNLSLALTATNYLEAGLQGSPILPFLECAGKFGSLCGSIAFMGALPEWRANTRLSYKSGPLVASLRWQWIDGMTNSENEFRALNNDTPGILAVPDLPSYSYFDLTFQYDLNDRLMLGLGVVNLADKEPPFMGSAASSANTDPRTYDTLGRRFFLNLNYRL